MSEYRGNWSTVGQITYYQPTDKRILDELVINEVWDDLTSRKIETEVAAIDMSKVKHLSARGLGILVSANQRWKKEGRKVAIVGVSPPIYEVFKITRLDKIFNSYDTRDQLTNAHSSGGLK